MGENGGTTLSLSVRELGEDDYGRMRAFWEAVCFPLRDPGAESREAVLRRMGLGTVVYLGLEAEEKLGGTAIVGTDGLDAWVRQVVVSHEARAQDGVRVLLDAARARSAAWGAEHLYAMFAEPRGDLWKRCLAAGCERIQGRALLRLPVDSES